MCIIQDDEDDWRNEASRMANIYENAVLTLGATASSSDTEGIFSASASIHDPLELYGKSSKGKEFVVYARQQLDHRLFEQPLFKRRWIFQERYLSTRFLHFTANELIWECKEDMDCECNQTKLRDSDSPDLAPAENSHLYYNAFKSYYLEAFTAIPYRVQIIWRDVIDSYSELELSHARDKLPALSGIANKFKQLRPNDSYFAGLWQSSFVEDLLWRSVSRGYSVSHLLPRPQKWRAPTWSWASVDAKVETRGNSYHSMS
jgi:hypothetical protein